MQESDWSFRKFSWWMYIGWLGAGVDRKKSCLGGRSCKYLKYVFCKYMGSAPVLETDFNPGVTRILSQVLTVVKIKCHPQGTGEPGPEGRGRKLESNGMSVLAGGSVRCWNRWWDLGRFFWASLLSLQMMEIGWSLASKPSPKDPSL